MSTERRGGGGRQFPVRPRRHVPVVDAGCGCRPRMLVSLPSFLKSSRSSRLGGEGAKAAVRRRGGGQYYASSTSTVSFSSSTCAGAHSSTGQSSAYSSSSDYYHYYHNGRATKLQEQRAVPVQLHHKAPNKSKTRQLRQLDTTTAAADAAKDDVGVAVEKESRDPRADFRESMAQMVVEMGLCEWDGLRCMLRRLLALNAPRHHAAILTAFAEVCAQIVAAQSSSQLPSPPPVYHKYRR